MTEYLTQVDSVAWRSLVKDSVPVGLAPIKIKSAEGDKAFSINPWAGWCSDVRVIGGDWVPVAPGGELLLEQMVHTPDIYLAKAKNLRLGQGCLELINLPVRKIEEEAVLLGGSPNYYHWLIDILPRLLQVRQYVANKKLLVPENLKSFQNRTLELLGYRSDDLITVADAECVRVNRLFVASLLAQSTFVHPEVPKILRRWFLPHRHPERPARRVFLSRADAASRRLVNEDELLPILGRYGFDYVVIGEMSFEKQVKLFSEVDVMLAVHGAGMTNMVFMPPQGRVIEIGCVQYPASWFKNLALVSRRPYQRLPGVAVTLGVDGNPLYGDWALDPQVLERALEQLGP